MNLTKKIFLVAAFLSPIFVIVWPQNFVVFGRLAWWLLVVIVFSRPLADIFRTHWLQKIVGLRKEIGILVGSLALCHVAGYFLNFDIPFSNFFNPKFWNLSNFFGWGMLALAAMLPPLLTSNDASKKWLRRKWKPVQMLTYFFFIFTAVHADLIRGLPVYSIVVGVWFVVWLKARGSHGERRTEPREN